MSVPSPSVNPMTDARDPALEAVLALPDEASAVVLGAPGTGKTGALLGLLERRLAAGSIAADEAMILAPSRQAATRLRDVAGVRLGVPTNGPLVRTVTSLAFDLVGAARLEAGLEPPRLLSGAEQDRIIAELLEGEAEGVGDSRWPRGFDPEVRRLRGFRTELRELAMRMTELGLDPAGLTATGERMGRPAWSAAGRFLRGYQSVLDQFRAEYLDSAELLASAALLAPASPRLDRLRLLLIDDVQDLPRGALDLVRSVARRGVPVIAAGDPDVSGSGYRGAGLEVLARPEQLLGATGARLLRLEVSHRQPAGLRAFTQAVTERIGTAGAVGHRAAASLEPGGAILRIEGESRARELAAVARRLREAHLLEGVAWKDMAVVVRSGSLVPLVERALRLGEVPVRTSAASTPVREALAARHLLLATAAALGARELDAALGEELLLGPLGGLDRIAVRRLRLALRTEELAGGGVRGSDELLAEALVAPERLATVDSPQARRAAKLARSLEHLRERVERSSVEELLWALWERSGLAEIWGAQSAGSGPTAVEANRHLDGVVALFEAARRFAERSPDGSASEFVEEMLLADVPEDTLAPQAAEHAVLVTTPPGVVGREFEVVAVAGLQEGVWPNRRLRGAIFAPQELAEAVDGIDGGTVDRRREVLGDELRMLALAVSRARALLVLSCTANDEEEPSPFLRLLPPDTPVQAGAAERPFTLRGLVGRLRREAAGGVLEAAPGGPSSEPVLSARAGGAARALARLAAADAVGAHPDGWYGLAEPSTVHPLVDLDGVNADGEPNRVAVSPSAIDTFETCPLHWFLDRVGGGSSNVSSGLGTIIHDVMEHAESTDVERLWAGVDARWPELVIEAGWQEAAERRKARSLTEALAEYLQDFERGGGELLGAETGFEIADGRARLRGTIDRVERGADGTVVIVDLKTGRSVPSAAAMDEHPQLAAYQLAVDAGAVPAVPEGAELGGAKLVIVSSGVRGKRYREPVQQRFDEERREAFRARVQAAAEGMAGRVFLARIDEHCLAPHAFGDCKVHVIGEVSG